MANISKDAYQLGAYKLVGYGVGDVGLNLLWVTTSTYLLFYYTDILGINPSTAGSIIFLAMLWDGITDPIMGFIAERVKTPMGTYRPFLLFGSIPLAVSFIAMFSFTPDTQNILLYLIFTHLLFRTLYTLVSVPYSSLSITMTTSSEARNWLASVRMMFALASGFIVAKYTRVAAAYFGNGDEAAGFPYIAFIYSVVAVIILFISFLCTSEETKARGASIAAIPIKAQLISMMKNRALLIVLGIVLTGYTGFQMFAKSLQYYITYNLSGDRADVGNTLALLIAIMTLLTPLWAWVAKLTSKRTVWVSGATVSVVALSSAYLVEITTVTEFQITIVFAAIGMAVIPLSFWSMIPDTTEYGEWKTGIRCEAAIIGVMSFTQKISLGLGVGLTGILIDLFGYRANETQTPETIRGIQIMVTLAPISLIVLSIFIGGLYPITHSLHKRIVGELRARESTE